MAGETTFDLVFKTKADLAGINALANGIQGSLAKIQSFNQQLQSGLTAMFGGAAALVGVAALRRYAQDAEQAALAQAKLSQALRNTNQDAGDYRSELDETSQALMKLTGIDDDVITAVQGQLIAFGAQRDQMKELTGLTLDFAEFMGTDATSAATLLGRALQGDEIMLRGVRFEIDKNLPKHAQLAQLIALLNRMVGAQAEEANKATGGMRGYRTELANVGEDVGRLELRLETPFLRGFVERVRSIVDGLKSLAEQFKDNSKSADGFIEGLGRIAGSAAPVILGLLSIGGGLRLLTFVAGPLKGVLLPLLAGLAAFEGLKALADWAWGAASTLQQLHRLAIAWSGFWFGMQAGVGNFIVETQAKLSQWKVDFTEGFQLAWIATQRVWTQIVSGLKGFLINIEFDFKEVLPRIKAQVYQWALDVANAINRVSLKGFQIDTTGLKSGLDAAINQVKGVGEARADEQKARLDALKTELDDLGTKAQALAADAARQGEEIDAARKERLDNVTANLNADLENLRAQSVELEASIAKSNAAAATAGAPRGGAAGAAGSGLSEKQQTELLSAAKFRLVAAEQSYHIALRETALLEQSGAITANQANDRNIQSTRNYLAELEKTKAQLPELIRQLEALGNTKGVEELKQQMGEVTIKTLEARLELQKLQDQTFFGKIHAQLTQLKNDWTDLGKQIGGFFVNTFQTVAASAAQALTSLIFHTNNWRQAFAQAAQSIVQNLIQIVIQWVLGQTIIAALNAVFGNTQGQMVNKLAAKAATAWAPAATAASIASYGAASGFGLAAFLAAIAAGTAGAAAASGFGGFAGGGRTGSRHKLAMVGEEGEEFVFTAPATRNIGIDRLYAMMHAGERGFQYTPHFAEGWRGDDDPYNEWGPGAFSGFPDSLPDYGYTPYTGSQFYPPRAIPDRGGVVGSASGRAGASGFGGGISGASWGLGYTAGMPVGSVNSAGGIFTGFMGGRPVFQAQSASGSYGYAPGGSYGGSGIAGAGGWSSGGAYGGAFGTAGGFSSSYGSQTFNSPQMGGTTIKDRLQLFATGIRVPGQYSTSDSEPAWVSKGEVILSSPVVQKWDTRFGRHYLDDMIAGKFPIAAPHYADGGRAGGGGGARGGSGSGASGHEDRSIAQAFFLDREQAAQWLIKHPAGQKQLIEFINGNRHQIR
jgi:hypothetical protein